MSAFGKAWGLAFGAAFGLVVAVPPAVQDQGGGRQSAVHAKAKPAPALPSLTEKVRRKDFAQLFSTETAKGLDSNSTETDQTQQAAQKRETQSAEPLTADKRSEAPISAARVGVPAVPSGIPGSVGSVGTAEPDSGRIGRIADESSIVVNQLTDIPSSVPLSPKAGEDTKGLPSIQAEAPVDSAGAAIKGVATFETLPDTSAQDLIAARSADDALAIVLILAALEAYT